MRSHHRNILFAILASLALFSCSSDYPVDEDGLLITNRAECYVSNFFLNGADHLSVLKGSAAVKNDSCIIRVTVLYGTDLKNLYPSFSLVTDAKLEPKITGLTDFSDLEHPRQYTVISGNRKVRKTYTVYLIVEQRPI
ncbi:MAG: hypothetical protein PHS30_00215 [Bacteroidales bacterium]|nr:hypothetical protein [Bacteroidales bacterium]